ncbi:MAG: hypothetical protein ABWY18_05425 [Tardiphaga sp.]
MSGDAAVIQLESEVDELIAACHGDLRGCIAALIMLNAKLEQDLATLQGELAGCRAGDSHRQHALN